jgi:hypothetical protein
VDGVGVFGCGYIGSNVLPFKTGGFTLLVLNQRVKVVLGLIISGVL